jgi:glycosyltransferase involved in cell wall biosynthesis
MLNPHGYVAYPPQLGKTDTGGQTLYVLELAKALGKKNINVDIVTRQFDNLPQEEEIFKNVKIIRIPAGPATFVQKEKMYELLPEMVDNFIKYNIKKRRSYDIIHSHYWDGGYAGIILSKMLNVPHVHTPHTLGKQKKLEMSVVDTPLQKLKPIYRYHLRIAVEQKIMNKANAIIVLCETSRIQILEHYIVEDFEKIQIIYPGINTEVFNPIKTKYDKDLNLKSNSILTVSRMVPAKGLDRVIDALALLKNKIDFHCYMGSGGIGENLSPEEKEAQIKIKKSIDEHKLTNRITMIGLVPHDTVLPAYYRNSDLFIIASRYEPFGLTTMEAMACGTIPIVSSVAGSREIIVDGLNGFIVDTHDRKTLAKTIEKALTDTKLHKKVADNAAFTIKEHYSWDKTVDKFLAVYKKLL